jgi:hypothetical protein
MFDYISGLANQKGLQTSGNTLNAHAIITNNLVESKMKDAATFLRASHRLSQDMPGFKLVFLMEPFLITLYDRVRSDEQGFGRRWGYLSQRFAWQMGQENADKYVLLDKAQADELADWVLQQPPIEIPVDLEALKDSLEDTMSGK